jgi:hypothetical protein
MLGRESAYSGKRITWDEMFENPSQSPAWYSSCVHSTGIDREDHAVEKDVAVKRRQKTLIVGHLIIALTDRHGCHMMNLTKSQRDFNAFPSASFPSSEQHAVSHRTILIQFISQRPPRFICRRS